MLKELYLTLGRTSRPPPRIPVRTHNKRQGHRQRTTKTAQIPATSEYYVRVYVDYYDSRWDAVSPILVRVGNRAECVIMGARSAVSGVIPAVALAVRLCIRSRAVEPE